MKFLLDVCVASRRMRDDLTSWGHDVLSALEKNPRATDEELLALAAEGGGDEGMEQHADAMRDGVLVVVTQSRVRIRQRERLE